MWTFSSVAIVTFICSLARARSAYRFYDPEQENRLKGSDWSIIEPTRVNDIGVFKSHHLLTTSVLHRFKRDTANSLPRVNYRLNLLNKSVHVVLEPNYHLYSDSLIINKTSTQAADKPSSSEIDNCFYIGHIKDELQSKVALSTCGGLTGILITADHHFFIEPLRGYTRRLDQPHPHVVYKTAHFTPSPQTLAATRDKSHCNTSAAEDVNSDNTPVMHQRQKRSISRNYFVETLVVVDRSMIEYYKDEDLNTYLFTIMNMVSVLFHDASIGNSIDISVVKLLFLDQDNVDGLEITHHADKTLGSFCRWQQSINSPEPDPSHHDLAILITRVDICSRMNEPCSTLGLSQVSGMCQQQRSCNVNQDTGLALAYTIAHEIGHNFGMEHDGFNECNTASKNKSFIMFPEFLIDAGKPLVWSNCSRQAITRFLDREWGFCLLDEPDSKHYYKYSDKPPGLLYDVDHQCRLQYGSGAEHCHGIESMCTTLWCRVNNHCVTRLEPAAEGTICAWENSTSAGLSLPQKWCYNGECSAIDSGPEAIDGGWAEWTSWTPCSRTCGGGVSISERDCINPRPANGGKYCLGERKKYSICQTQDCPPDQPSFLEVQCSRYNSRPYKSEFYNWEPVLTNNPCQLNCKPENMFFSVMLNDMVEDGTPCRSGTNNMCITGRCRTVGCDWKLDSNATEDRCGICHGDGMSCTTVKDQYKGQKTLEGQAYVEATVIPAGARNIRVEEVAEANNYLAVRSETGEYYLNGYWYIQWTGNYNMAGTTVHYERLGNKEGITAPGPIKEPLHIMLLFQSHNPGVAIEYTVPNMNESTSLKRNPVFSWSFTDWSHCTVSCGGGYQRKKVVCSEKEAGIVEDAYCHNITKPDDKAKPCNAHLCPARWWEGPWQHCSATCGNSGERHRTVLCIRSLGADEQIALDESDCASVPKPKATADCGSLPACPDTWRTGPWTECKDPCDVQTRKVVCTASEMRECLKEFKPVRTRPCSHRVTCGRWKSGNWSQCSKTCGQGVKHRVVRCDGGETCRTSTRPADFQPCNNSPCYGYSEPRQSSHNRLEKNARDGIKGGTNKNLWNKIWNYVTGKGSKESKHKNKTSEMEVTKYNETWIASEWEKCPVSCGVGRRGRHVWCPLSGYCNPNTKPADSEECQGGECVSWVTGPWHECSVTCGTGTQKRKVECVHILTEEITQDCDRNTKPSNVQDCQHHSCNSTNNAVKGNLVDRQCDANKLDLETCTKLKDRGFCAFKYVSRNCCKLCTTVNI